MAHACTTSISSLPKNSMASYSGGNVHYGAAEKMLVRVGTDFVLGAGFPHMIYITTVESFETAVTTLKTRDLTGVLARP